jgi:predicted DNA-binding transcriptional regulator YafY
VLLLLQTREHMTAQELADLLEVSVRTIYRDIDSLNAAGVPVYGEPGHEGGYRLVDGYRTRLTGMTTAEAEAIFLAGLPDAAAQLGLEAAVNTARLKLTAALTDQSREHANRISDRFHLDAPTWYHEPDIAPHLKVVSAAVWHQHELLIQYLRWNTPRELTRTIQPYGLVLKGGRWYMVAQHNGKLRTYRISRIIDAQELPATFTRATDFDLATYWREYLKRFDQRRHQDQATLKLSPEGWQKLPYLMEPTILQAAQRTAATPDVDGWRQVTIPIESVEAALADLLRLGADVEILTPDHLRLELLHTLAALNRLYGTDPAGLQGPDPHNQ